MISKKICSILLFVFLLATIFWSYRITDDHHTSQPSLKAQIAHSIRTKVAKTLKKELGLIPFGFGGRMMHEIKRISLAFQYPHRVTIKEARRLLIHSVDTFLNEINAHEKVRPYLVTYPFMPKNVEIEIFILNPDHSNVKDGGISFIVAEAGELRYKYKDSRPENECSKVITETYEEAVAILKHEENS